MVTDKLGNPLKEGDIVQVTYISQANQAHSVELVGRIHKISEGGIVTPKGQHLGKHPEHTIVTPGSIGVIVDFSLSFNPAQSQLAGVLKACEPAAKEPEPKLVKQ